MKNPQEKFQQYLNFELADEENIEAYENEVLAQHQPSGHISLEDALQKYQHKRRKRQRILGALGFLLLLFPSFFFIEPHFSGHETNEVIHKSTSISASKPAELQQAQQLIQAIQTKVQTESSNDFVQELQEIEQQIDKKNYESALRQLKKLSHQSIVQERADLRQHITDLFQILVPLYQETK